VDNSKKKWLVLAAVACGTFMSTLDSSIVNIALPTLTKIFETPISQVKWVVIVYLLAITVLVLPFGRLSDQYGRKRLFQWGFAIFTLGSFLCGLSATLGWLLFSRMVQGLGCAMLMANGPAIITSVFPQSERGSALGVLSMVVSVGLLSGPPLGGMLVSFFSWKSIFWVNLPIGLVGIFMVGKYFDKAETLPPAKPFDWAGAILQLFILVFFIIIFDPPNISISQTGLTQIPRWLLTSALGLLVFVFYQVEKQSPAPLIDFSLLRNHVFWTSLLASYLVFVSYSSVTVLMPFFLEESLKLDPKMAGLFMAAIPIAIFIVAPISGKMSDRIGTQELSLAGAIIGALVLFMMSGVFGEGVNSQMSSSTTILALASMGLAIGLFQSPNNNAIMGSVPTDKLGVASALLATVRNLGMVTGTGLATAIFSWQLNKTQDFVESIHFTQQVAGFIGILSVVAVLVKFKERS